MPQPKTLLSFCAIALLGLAPAALAFGPGGPPPGMNPERRLEKHLEELGLSSGQHDAVQAILEQARSARAERFERMRAEFEQMQTLLEQDLPDEAAVMLQAERLGELHTEGHKAMLHTLLAVRAQLDPEQRARLRERMREDRAHGRHRHHRREAPEQP